MSTENNEPLSNPYVDEEKIPFEIWDAGGEPRFLASGTSQQQVQAQEILQTAYPSFASLQAAKEYSAYPAPPFPASAYNPPTSPYYAPTAQQQRTAQDEQLRSISVGSLVGALLLMLMGFFWLYLVVLTFISNVPELAGGIVFSLIFVFLSFVGGGITLYHSIRALMGKPSARFALPSFWIWLSVYVIVLVIGFALQILAPIMISPTLAICFMLLAIFLPAGGLIALSLQHFSPPPFVLTWRRAATSFLNGATGATTIAMLLIFVIALIMLSVNQFFTCSVNPGLAGCSVLQAHYPFLVFFLLAVLVPLIEEMVKPWALLLLANRMRGVLEAFLLGVICGVGFGCIEAALLVGSATSDWLAIALVGLVFVLGHSFSTGLTTSGWYHLIHKEERRVRKTTTYWLSAIILHIIINASWAVALLPEPFGPAIRSWHPALGSLTITAAEVLFVVEIIAMFLLFLFMAGRLKTQASQAASTTNAI